MRKVIFESSVSLDGYIEGPNGELDWLPGRPGSNVGHFFSAFDTAFFGRKTYEAIGAMLFAERSRTSAERDFFYALCGMRKYVFSRTLKHVDGNGMVISRDLEEEVGRIRDEKGKNIWFRGGSDLLMTFKQLDLVDEYLITVHPVRLHSGKALFPDRQLMQRNLVLVRKKTLPTGAIVLHYRPLSRSKIVQPW